VLGILSLILWSLIWVVSIKYVMFILRADNQGEGGTMALTALARRATASHRAALADGDLRLIGAALFYGDSMITPAMSVLSAVEGMGLAFDGIDHWVVPISLVVLVALFLMQKHGTEKIGKLFGPIMVTWFLVLGALGVHGISQSPEVLKAFNPGWACVSSWCTPAWAWRSRRGGAGADRCRGAVRRHGPLRPQADCPAWFILVLPALVLNYFGQGALLLNPEARATRSTCWRRAGRCCRWWAGHPGHGDRFAGGDFRGVLPDPSGHSAGLHPAHADSAHLQRRAGADLHRCGELDADGRRGAAGDRLRVLRRSGGGLRRGGDRHHADDHHPGVGGDAAAVEVATAAGGADSVGFLLVDGLFFAANVPKIVQGGAFPVLAGCAVRADDHLEARQADSGRAHRRRRLPLPMFISSIRVQPPHRVEGTAVFLTARSDAVPHALLHNMLHNQVLHSQVVLLTVVSEDIRGCRNERFEVEAYGDGFFRVILHFGSWMSRTCRALKLCHLDDLDFSRCAPPTSSAARR
jgi:KUP system potassium uptake protein